MDQTNTPKQIQDLANSAKLFDMCMKIGGEFNLNLDQIGELDAQIRGVLRGKEKASTFSSDIQSLLEIDADKARALTTRINTEVFDAVKAALESHAQETSVQAIEQAGGFEIERPTATAPAPAPITSTDTGSADKPLNLLSDSSAQNEAPVEQKRDIVAGIENPEPAPVRKEPLVEELLRNTKGIPEQKIVREAPATPPVPPQPTGSDPYREAIE